MFVFITLMIFTYNKVPDPKVSEKAKKPKERKILLNPSEDPKNIIKNKKLAKKNCKLFSTNWSVAGWNDNEIKYFHKHPIRCPRNHALKYFRLFTNNKRAKFQRGSFSMRFKYICCKIKTIDCEKKVSKSISGTNLYTLARIGNVKCGCEKVLRGFQIRTQFDNYGKNPQTRIHYKCCSLYQKGLKTFRTHKKSTGFSDSGYGRNIFLDKHQINCGRSGFIKNFHAITKAKNTSGFNPYLKFKYSCLVPVIKKINKKKKGKKKRVSKLSAIKKILALGAKQKQGIFHPKPVV